MRKLFLSIIVVLFMIQSAAAQFNAKVDEKFELTSIVFCLAGSAEYQPGVPSYRKDIIAYFKPYEYTEPIEYIRLLAKKHSIGYNAVSTTADMLEINNGRIRLQPKYTIANVVEYDYRWNEETFTKYVEVLNTFYKKSKFNKFFQNHKPLYDSVEQIVNKQIDGTAVEWFKSFYGKDLDSNLKVYISLTNGYSNYAMNSGVLLGITSDKEGQPYVSDATTNLLIHEFSHHYANEIFDAYWDQMKDAANIIYPKVQKKMIAIGYGDPETVMAEWFVRLCCLMYDKETDFIRIKANIYLFNVNTGFIWMKNSFDFMDHFYANRDKYPTIKEFMPQLVAFLNYTSDNIELVEKEATRRPYITSIYPALGSDISNETEMIITFSEPMAEQRCTSYDEKDGYLDLTAGGSRSVDPSLHKWSEDGLKYTYKLPHDLQPGSKYGVKLTCFMSQRCIFMDKIKIEIIYTTAEK